MKITTGYDFQGYYITEYLDVIFDEMLVGLGFGKSILSGLDNMFSALTGSEATAMIEKLNDVKAKLRDRVISKAKRLGANGLIGIDFESSKLGDLIMVSMTATAVKIDRIVSPLPRTASQVEEEEKAARLAELEKKREEKIQLIKETHSSFDAEAFFADLCKYQSTEEISEYIRKMAEVRPDVFDDEIMQKVQKGLQLERIYGPGTGRKTVLMGVKTYFKLQ